MRPSRAGVPLSALLWVLLLLAATNPLAAAGDLPARLPADAASDRLDLMFEGFEVSLPPLGWGRLNLGTSHTWVRTFNRRRSGAFSAWVESGPDGTWQDEWLVAPVDLSGTVAPQVEWYESESDWPTLGEHHYLMASTTSATDPAAFTVLRDMTPADHVIAGFDGDPMVVDLSAYANEPLVYLAWRYVGSQADDWYIDDLRVFESLDVDIRGIAMAPDGLALHGEDVITPVATFLNDGQSTESFDATLEILASGEIVHSELVPVTSLPAGETIELSFSPFTLTDGHLYELAAVASAVEDGNPANDTTTGYVTTYTVPRVPLGLLFTNAGCDPCVDANHGLDEYLLPVGNAAACIRIHVGWPDALDIMYQFNPDQVLELVAEYDIGPVPVFFMDGHEGSYAGSTMGPQYEARLQVASPSVIELRWLVETGQLEITVQNQEMIRPDTSLRLLVAITEDDIFYAGPNGETTHHQAMRRYLPDTAGTMPVPLDLGGHAFLHDLDLSGAMVYENLRATAYLQDTASREVLQAATAFLSEIETVISAVGGCTPKGIRLENCVPNPFNPSTGIVFRLPERERVELDVFALNGARVATLISDMLDAGEHHATWRGTDAAGRPVASGTYFLRLKASGSSLTRPMMLVR